MRAFASSPEPLALESTRRAPRRRGGTYEKLMSQFDPQRCDALDAHVLASSLGMAGEECGLDQDSVLEGTGLDGRSLEDLLAACFPGAESLFGSMDEMSAPIAAPVEACLRELLASNSTSGVRLEQWLAVIVARRAQRPNHLWQDLGLRDRGELSSLMNRHFAPLAACNTHDMKWKKFLYRILCQGGGLSACAAPTCSECQDIEACFGEERGESLLSAHRRNGAPSPR